MSHSKANEILSILTAMPRQQAAKDLSLLAHKHQLMINLKNELLKPAAVLIPLVQRQGTWHVVLTQRTSHLSHHAGQISFPGGKLNQADESPVAAALREAQEEIGVQKVSVMAELGNYQSYSGFNVSTVLGVVDHSSDFKLNPSEVEAILEVPLDVILESSNFEHQRTNKDGEWRQYYQMMHQNQRIWGFTGSLLFLLGQWMGGLLVEPSVEL